jgi:hypothetical protein
MDLVIDGEDSCIKGPSISYTIAKIEQVYPCPETEGGRCGSVFLPEGLGNSRLLNPIYARDRAGTHEVPILRVRRR